MFTASQKIDCSKFWIQARCTMLVCRCHHTVLMLNISVRVHADEQTTRLVELNRQLRQGQLQEPLARFGYSTWINRISKPEPATNHKSSCGRTEAINFFGRKRTNQRKCQVCSATWRFVVLYLRWKRPNGSDPKRPTWVEISYVCRALVWCGVAFSFCRSRFSRSTPVARCRRSTGRSPPRRRNCRLWRDASSCSRCRNGRTSRPTFALPHPGNELRAADLDKPTPEATPKSAAARGPRSTRLTTIVPRRRFSAALIGIPACRCRTRRTRSRTRHRLSSSRVLQNDGKQRINSASSIFGDDSCGTLTWCSRPVVLNWFWEPRASPKHPLCGP